MSRLESGEGGGSHVHPEMGLSEPLTSWLSPGLACAWSSRAQASPRPGAVVSAGGLARGVLREPLAGQPSAPVGLPRRGSLGGHWPRVRKSAPPSFRNRDLRKVTLSHFCFLHL